MCLQLPVGLKKSGIFLIIVFVFSACFNIGVSLSETIDICSRNPKIRRQIQKEITVLRGETGLPEQIDCSTVQREELESIESLIIAGKKDSQLTKLSEEDFRCMIGLKYLDLGENSLTEIPTDAFSDLTSLETLNLSNNNIRDLGDALKPLESLKHLFLYGNRLGIGFSIGLTAPFSENRNLERIILSYNGIRKFPDKLFVHNKKLKIIVLSFNAIETFPDTLFAQDPQVEELYLRMNQLDVDGLLSLLDRGLPLKKVDAIWNRRIRTGDFALIKGILGDTVTVLLSEDDFKNPVTPESASLETSEIVANAVKRVQEMTLRYWNLPFRSTGYFSEKGGMSRSGGLERAIEEKIAVRELNEAKHAYRTTPFDFYGVDISFVEQGKTATKKVDIVFTPTSVDLKIDLPVQKSHVTSRDTFEDPWISPQFFVTTGDILDKLSETFQWKRSSHWYDQMPRGCLKGALDRDLNKIEEIQKKLDIDMFLLRNLIEEVISRSHGSGEKITLSQPDLEFARFIQFRMMFALQRLLNTLGRWRLAFYDNNFAYFQEALSVLYGSSVVFQAYLNSFLRAVSDKINHGRRNPLFKMLNKKLEDSLFVYEGRRSIGFPEGSLIGLLELRTDEDLYQWFGDIKRRFDSYHSENIPPELNPTIRALRVSEGILREERNQLSSMDAGILITESDVKDTILGGFYKIVREVGTIIGDIRFLHPLAAMADFQLDRLEEILEPGDILLSRQDYYASNIFLPGFWPHALLYLGPIEKWGNYKLGEHANFTDQELAELEFPPNTPLRAISSLSRKIERYAKGYEEKGLRVIEAVSEGVQFSSLKEAVQKDYIMVLRPLFDSPEKREHGVARAIYSALRFEGAPYDFDFDFTTDDKIVCTELVYRAYDWLLRFSAQKDAPADEKPIPRIPGMKTTAGRDTMPAQEIARLVVYMNDHPEGMRRRDGDLLYPGRRLELLRLVVKDGEAVDGRYQAKELEDEEALAWVRESLNR